MSTVFEARRGIKIAFTVSRDYPCLEYVDCEPNEGIFSQDVRFLVQTISYARLLIWAKYLSRGTELWQEKVKRRTCVWCRRRVLFAARLNRPWNNSRRLRHLSQHARLNIFFFSLLLVFITFIFCCCFLSLLFFFGCCWKILFWERAPRSSENEATYRDINVEFDLFNTAQLSPRLWSLWIRKKENLCEFQI